MLTIKSWENVIFLFSQLSKVRSFAALACYKNVFTVLDSSYHHLHDANVHLSSAGLKTPPIMPPGLQSVSESYSKSIAHLLIFLHIFLFSQFMIAVLQN